MYTLSLTCCALGCRAASRELAEPGVERGADGLHVLLHHRRRAAQREPEALEACQHAQDGRAQPRALAAAAAVCAHVAVEGEHERPDRLHARGDRPLEYSECGLGGVAHSLEAADSALAQARARAVRPGRSSAAATASPAATPARSARASAAEHAPASAGRIACDEAAKDAARPCACSPAWLQASHACATSGTRPVSRVQRAAPPPRASLSSSLS